ncbi:hypothetical protein H2203_001568 [Taxawa tesnikishii (nom. ined.)]|nr:hypothetical protein H2203_001568 [Dothideales sp. JES 119]
MAPLGKIIIVTVGMEDIVVPLFSFLSKEPSIIGSCSATPKEVDQMLEFAAFHKIKPVLQTFAMTQEGITGALDKLEKNQIR